MPALLPLHYAAASTAHVPDALHLILVRKINKSVTLIDPGSNTVETTLNLTSFYEDTRPPFLLVTGGLMPAFVSMIHKLLFLRLH